MHTQQHTTDRIEKTVTLKSPRARVWRALTDATEFATWFHAKLDGPFEAGKRVRGSVSCTGHEGVPLEMEIQRIEPQTLFSFRWHPFAIDPKVDYSKEPTTLVEFRLEDEGGGTRLTVVESGFDRLPASRRDAAFRMNSAGWDAQIENVVRHVSG